MSTEQTPTAITGAAATVSAAPVEAPAPAVPETALAKLTARLVGITARAEHSEMWGVELSPSAHAPTQVILLKFLRANNNDVAAAEKQLTSALEWRKKFQPTKLVSETFDKKKFGDLGYVTTHKDEAGTETVITWNIYGAVRDNNATFGNVEEFIRWRAALMELGVQKLRLNDITEAPAEDGEDIHRMIQVHDYRSVSFFRMDPAVKAASKATIETLSMAYPELLAHKYFVNVPAVMGWVFGVMKLFLAPATLRKFHPISSGTSLSTELKSISSSLPKEYGGQGPSVTEAETVKLVDDAPATMPIANDAQTEAKPVDSSASTTTPVVTDAEVKAAEAEPLAEERVA